MATNKNKPTAEKKTKRVDSRAKGAGFERTLSKFLSEKLNPLKFTRSQMSGAIVGGVNYEKVGANYKREALRLFVGDVVPTNEGENGISFNFSVEAKFYKTVPTMKQLFDDTCLVYGWMEEAIIDAAKLDVHPIVIFKFNNTPIFTATPSHVSIPEGVNHTKLKNGINVCMLDDLIQHLDFWVTKT